MLLGCCLLHLVAWFDSCSASCFALLRIASLPEALTKTGIQHVGSSIRHWWGWSVEIPGAQRPNPTVQVPLFPRFLSFHFASIFLILSILFILILFSLLNCLFMSFLFLFPLSNRDRMTSLQEGIAAVLSIPGATTWDATAKRIINSSHNSLFLLQQGIKPFAAERLPPVW